MQHIVKKEQSCSQGGKKGHLLRKQHNKTKGFMNLLTCSAVGFGGSATAPQFHSCATLYKDLTQHISLCPGCLCSTDGIWNLHIPHHVRCSGAVLWCGEDQPRINICSEMVETTRNTADVPEGQINPLQVAMLLQPDLPVSPRKTWSKGCQLLQCPFVWYRCEVTPTRKLRVTQLWKPGKVCEREACSAGLRDLEMLSATFQWCQVQNKLPADYQCI